MAEIEKKPVKIVETILRDAHQSLIATRMTTEQMLPIVDKLDKVGYHAVECWGGATFDASLRFLHEIRGKDFVNYVTVSRIQSFRCFSVARTFLVIAHMLMMLLSILFRNLWQMVLTSSVSSTA